LENNGSLYDQLCSFENLYSAYVAARECKRSRDYVISFEWNAERNLLALKRELEDGDYRHGKYAHKVVEDSKRRDIKVAPFRDRIVHHALCNVIEPVFERGFIADSYACRASKGNHRAVKRLTAFLNRRGGEIGFVCSATFPSILRASTTRFSYP
jgi:retron-type reverse transcriptase